jgi:signal transduction histidine kinase
MTTPQLPAPEIHPVSPHVLRVYGRFWDIVTLLVFGAWAVIVVWNDWGALTWRHWVVFGLIVAQAALYVFAITLRGWPIAGRWLALYFIGGISMWVVAGLIYPTVWWVGMTYFGQMFGLLPARFVVPGSLVVNILIVLYISDWNPANITPGLLWGFAFQWAGAMAVYLFIASVIRTSQDRGALVARLEAAQLELQAAREKDVELAALRERERLARDLHDSLGHALTTIAVQLEAIQRLYRVDPERGAQHVEELKTLTRNSMADLRRSLDGLRAPGLGERKLSEALQALSVEVGRRAALAVSCRVPPEADSLSPAVQETLWRVAQESLTNIEKHARARRAELRFELHPEAATLVVKDDGVGIPPQADTWRGHYGLRGMRERVEGLGGMLTLANGADGGALITAALPLVGSPGQLSRKTL